MVIQEASVEAIGRYNCAANNGVTNDDGEPIVDSVDVDIKVTGLYSSSAYTSFIICVPPLNPSGCWVPTLST